MLISNTKNYYLSGNALKIIAAITMLIDHIGMILFPSITVLRIIGRLSFPIFAFMISEGAAHTKNKLKYFLSVFVLGTLCQTALYIYDSNAKLGVLISFSLAIISIYALDFIKNTLLSKDCKLLKKFFSALTFVLTILFVYFLNTQFRIDYGFFGCMAPVSAALLKAPKNCNSPLLKSLDTKLLHLLCFGICTTLIALKYGGIQGYSIFAILFLLFYSGKRGKLKMKYFFYLFYPLHLAALQGIYLLTTL